MKSTTMPMLTLIFHPQPLSIHRLPPSPEASAIAASVFLQLSSQSTHLPLTSITQTANELSLILPSAIALAASTSVLIRTETDWRAVQVAGTLDFALVGILAHLTAPLKDVGVSVFCVSTFDTDWILVKDHAVDTARKAWETVGCICVTPD